MKRPKEPSHASVAMMEVQPFRDREEGDNVDLSGPARNEVIEPPFVHHVRGEKFEAVVALFEAQLACYPPSVFDQERVDVNADDARCAHMPQRIERDLARVGADVEQVFVGEELAVEESEPAVKGLG